ncbi:proprotein convertase P-domain-containing protein [Streptomyces halobius]|uniref:Proprotein convertase P-domain-containing protein n=1 Tax=Streptomyces halobius TaxID=2879846 RepID=A0ABY4M2K2_9ACTN|nr:proprotein convertase P-domain-containing protein [Streptomyces halobius]UQA92000.1 proprotein convertase P-domain-containing protein [Streptomyces halobius]
MHPVRPSRIAAAVRPTRLAAALAGLALILTAGPAATAVPADTAEPRPRSVTLEEAVTTAMLGQSRAERSPLAERNAGTEVNIQRRHGGWVFGSAVIKAPKERRAHPRGWLFLAHEQDGGGWKSALDTDPAFAALVQRAPAAVVSAGEKKTFAANAMNAQDTPSTQPPQNARITQNAPGSRQEKTGLALPYTLGKTWKIIGGLHGWSGQPRPWSSIDLDSRESNREVLSAQSGRAYWMCSNGGHLRVVHDNGWTTEYYHLLDEIRPDGDPVRLGEYLGLTSTRIPCGGSAGSNHVHFALKKGGSFVPMASNVIGGWDYFEGNSAYGGGAVRGDDYRYTGDDLRNYGPEDGRTFHREGRTDIPDPGEATAAVKVSGIEGNAPADLQVYADIHHPYRGDVQLDLIAPDGTAYRLRDADPNDGGDLIHEQYTVDASAEPANGTWRLRATDTDGGDNGYIDAVFLTF